MLELLVTDIYPHCAHTLRAAFSVYFLSTLGCFCNSGNILPKGVNVSAQVSLRKEIREVDESLRKVWCKPARLSELIVAAWVWKPKCGATVSQGSFKGRGETSNRKPKLTVQADRKHYAWVKQEWKTWKTVRLTIVVYALQIFQTQEKLRK